MADWSFRRYSAVETSHRRYQNWREFGRFEENSGEFTRSFDEPAISIGVPISRGLRAELNGSQDPVNGASRAKGKRGWEEGEEPGRSTC